MTAKVKEKSTETESEKKSQIMEKLLAKHGDKVKLLAVGDVVEGKVIFCSKNVVKLDLDPLGVGIVFGRELGEDFSKDKYPLGTKVLASVLELEDEEGQIILSFRKAGKERIWQEIASKCESGETLTVKPIEANKGGLIISLSGVRGFLPLSQLSAKNYPLVSGGDKDEIYSRLLELVGKPINVKILDFDQKENKLIFSEKATASEEKKSVIDGFKIGQKIKGKITGIVDFGAFVDIGGLEGLIHISEISWDKVTDISKFLKVGQEVEVIVIGKENDRVSLSLKRLTTDPWGEEIKKYKVGDLAKGEVSRITPFGAFIKLNDKIEGLVHISELSEKHLKTPEEVLKVGEKLNFRIISIEPDSRKISLSLKSAKEDKTKGK